MFFKKFVKQLSDWAIPPPEEWEEELKEEAEKELEEEEEKPESALEIAARILKIHVDDLAVLMSITPDEMELVYRTRDGLDPIKELEEIKAEPYKWFAENYGKKTGLTSFINLIEAQCRMVEDPDWDKKTEQEHMAHITISLLKEGKIYVKGRGSNEHYLTPSERREIYVKIGSSLFNAWSVASKTRY